VTRVHSDPRRLAIGGWFGHAEARRTARSRGESLDQVLDRNLSELLQELRVTITGVQILFAFLLGIAFTQRFADIDPFALTLYCLALLCTAAATILLIAPVSFHRLIFRRRQKAALVAAADRMLVAGLGFLALAISSAVMLILEVTLGRWAAVAGGGGTALVAGLFWYAFPLWARRTGAGLAPDPAELAPRPEEEDAPPAG
jgi:hypothetical protein